MYLFKPGNLANGKVHSAAKHFSTINEYSLSLAFNNLEVAGDIYWLFL